VTDRVAVLAGPGILMFQEVNNWGGGVRTLYGHISAMKAVQRRMTA
jgi:hypothetical protein